MGNKRLRAENQRIEPASKAYHDAIGRQVYQRSDIDITPACEKYDHQQYNVGNIRSHSDPTYTGTDHTREYVPFLAYAKGIHAGALAPEDTFAVIGATIADNFGVAMPEGTIGTSILDKLVQG